MNLSKNFNLILLVFLCLFCVQVRTYANDVSLVSAVDAYENGEFQRSLEQLYQLDIQRRDSPELHYNLGVVHYKNQDLGRSYYHLLKSVYLNPRYQDGQYNLAFVRKKRGSTYQGQTPWLVQLKEFILESMPFQIDELYWVSFLLASLAFIYWGWIVFRFQRLFSWAALLPIVVAFIVFFIAQFKEQRLRDFGVVIQADSEVRSGIGRAAITVYKLAAGQEFLMVQTRKDWARIQLADGKNGWIQRTNIMIDESWN